MTINLFIPDSILKVVFIGGISGIAGFGTTESNVAGILHNLASIVFTRGEALDVQTVLALGLSAIVITKLVNRLLPPPLAPLVPPAHHVLPVPPTGGRMS
ncbi:MAG: hypothetical protein Q8K75_05760 [Chlamydiales bacterium]|nr:hypothetical protein [Chlamydiales bacterium]